MTAPTPAGQERADRDEATLGQNLVALSRWIDANNAHRDPEAVLWSRVLKVTEEAGEVYAALSGVIGENPRKGVTHTFGDVVDELLDVASAALCAVEHIELHHGRALDLLAERVARTVMRAGLTGDPSAAAVEVLRGEGR